MNATIMGASRSTPTARKTLNTDLHQTRKTLQEPSGASPYLGIDDLTQGAMVSAAQGMAYTLSQVRPSH